ncbi:hypothetical protein [Klenkia brasiliensis]|nr:hypothetical protein [Klenkia brasiliensis]
MSALREIERELSQAGPRPVRWRRASTWIGLWLAGAVALVVGGLVLGTAAAVVLGVAWAVGAGAAHWASRHLVVVASDDLVEAP